MQRHNNTNVDFLPYGGGAYRAGTPPLIVSLIWRVMLNPRKHRRSGNTAHAKRPRKASLSCFPGVGDPGFVGKPY